MKTSPKLLSLALCTLCILAGGAGDAFASRGPYYPDITAKSPSRKYKVVAISPDNIGEKEFRPTFQKSFVYTFRDTEKDEVLWIRKQPMKTRTDTTGPDKGRTYTVATEESPSALFVSDAGWTVIRTGRDNLIVVDIAGKDRGTINLLKDGMTEKESKEYVEWTSAGPMWKGCSLWYILDAVEQPVFVVTPWWGRRIIIDLKSVNQVSETPGIAKQAALYEKNFVLAELRRDASSLDAPSPPPREYKNINARINEYRRFITAAYVAGRDKITEAIPMLEELQNSTRDGISTTSYSTFPIRQVAQLSLRRLGKTPEPLPAMRYKINYEQPDVPRVANAGKIKPNMTPEDVLSQIDAPDFSSHGTSDWPWGETWEYDMDAETPFTLLVHWSSENKVARVEQKTPPLWQDPARDRERLRFIWNW